MVSKNLKVYESERKHSWIQTKKTSQITAEIKGNKDKIILFADTQV